MTAAYLYDAVRTPFGRFNGALAGVRSDDLASYVIKALLERHPHLDGGAIDEVIFGNANGAGEDNRNLGRMAGLLAGLPVTVPATTVNRLCGSSLDAAMIASRSIETGDAEVMARHRAAKGTVHDSAAAAAAHTHTLPTSATLVVARVVRDE